MHTGKSNKIEKKTAGILIRRQLAEDISTDRW